MRKLVVIAIVGILVVGGGAILAILYLGSDEAPAYAPPPETQPAPPPAHGYDPAVMPPPGAPGPSGPSGPPREIPRNLKSPPGVPMQPAPDPRADKMETIRQDRFESSMDALNRRAEERLRRAGKRPAAPVQPPSDSTPGR